MNHRQMTLWPTSRRGSILPWFAVSLFVLLPLAALVVDMSLVRLTRRQMQTAVNTAALEGLRWRDELAIADWDERDEFRREKARQIVRAIFDDDLLATPDDDALNFGAGPVVEFFAFDEDLRVAGTDFQASRQVNPNSFRAFKPDLQLNLDNEIHGDMAAGQYRVTKDHREGPVNEIPPDPELDDPYERKDFKTEQSQVLGNSTDFDPNTPLDAFLVRLRRTQKQDDAVSTLDSAPNVSSTGPTVPFLFGRGGIAGATDLWNRRERGTIVRATAIANAVPAVSVGVPSPSNQLNYGLAPFAMSRSYWETIPVDDERDVTIDMNNSERVVDELGELLGFGIIQEVTTLGMQLPIATVSLLENGVRYLPIVDSVNMIDRVISFGMIEVTNSTPTSATIRKIASQQVASMNASAVFTRKAPLGLTQMEWESIFYAAIDMADIAGGNPSNNAPVLAPALQRTVP